MTDNHKQTKNEKEDQDLNDLLDSALKDFDKISMLNTENGNATSILDTEKQTDKCETVETVEKKWTEDFIKQTTDQFERNLQNLLQNGGDNEVGIALQRLGQASANNVPTGDDNISADFRSTLSQVLKDLSITSEHVQNEVDLAAIFGQTSQDTGDILPFMQGMMQHLLSKEILYPSLKEISCKYPTWLEEHKAILNPADLERYIKQSDLMQKVCIELEKEKEDDTEDVKRVRFESVLSLMQEMQNYGQAPEDLVGEQSTLFQFDSEGNPTLPLPPGVESHQDCCIM